MRSSLAVAFLVALPGLCFAASPTQLASADSSKALMDANNGMMQEMMISQLAMPIATSWP
ncbi:MAG TPA: hypothetical protein VGJ31_05640 [Dongiaceae bacterium]